ncbi:MAG TPA: homoserine kinase [Thermoanaerobacterales bacterium]|nr:homoserine kinase [Thermoanaerobacterales bacterium]
MVRVKVPATTANFGSGFDCLGAALGLYNYIEMDFAKTDEIEVMGEGEKTVEKNKTNLVYKAASRVFDEVGISKPIKISLENNIPIARGLGSSAACIAGGLVAANQILGEPLPFSRIVELATQMEGHPDNVVPALFGGFTISMVYEGKVIYKRFSIPNWLRFVVGIPQFSIRTIDARRVIPEKIDFSDAIFNLSRCAMLVASFAKNELSNLDVFCQDKLHQPYRNKLVPGMEKIIKTSKQQGAMACFLSGAGPSVLTITSEENAKKLGIQMVDIFKKEGIKAQYKILSPCDSGVEYIQKSF